MTIPVAAAGDVRAPRPAAAAPVGLAWLVTVRWTMLVAAIGTVVAGRSGLGVTVPMTAALGLLAAFAASNAWLNWRVRRSGAAAPTSAAGVLVCADVLLLSWLLLKSGGVLNPASVFYLVQIVLAALVLGRTWTWIVTGLSVGGYALLFLTPSDELLAAQGMHPGIAAHMRGMWIAFAITAIIIGLLVTRLAIAIERRDRALEALHDRTARASRLAGLATLAAGAAHELSTPLATILVAAHELERSLAMRQADHDLQQDAQLIRAEIERCRKVLSDMAGRAADPLGEAPRPSSVGAVLAQARAHLTAAEQARVTSAPAGADGLAVIWPAGVVAAALANLVRNGLQASDAKGTVAIEANGGAGRVRISVIDCGSGMPPEVSARAGEPFFTTKAPGAGTGLGLFVARSSIEQLGGALTIASQAGRGTTATIVLPVDVVQSGARP